MKIRSNCGPIWQCWRILRKFLDLDTEADDFQFFVVLWQNCL